MMAWSRFNGREGRLLLAGRFALTSLHEFNIPPSNRDFGPRVIQSAKLIECSQPVVVA